jgi:hypothetical protein
MCPPETECVPPFRKRRQQPRWIAGQRTDPRQGLDTYEVDKLIDRVGANVEIWVMQRVPRAPGDPPESPSTRQLVCCRHPSIRLAPGRVGQGSVVEPLDRRAWPRKPASDPRPPALAPMLRPQGASVAFRRADQASGTRASRAPHGFWVELQSLVGSGRAWCWAWPRRWPLRRRPSRRPARSSRWRGS